VQIPISDLVCRLKRLSVEIETDIEIRKPLYLFVL